MLTVMEVHVDRAKCQGHARCHAICPQVFELDDEGFSFVPVPAVPPELESLVVQAIDNCPERAISSGSAPAG
jgi:ferredoxin